VALPVLLCRSMWGRSVYSSCTSVFSLSTHAVFAPHHVINTEKLA
jgi:hypothetical protein